MSFAPREGSRQIAVSTGLAAFAQSKLAACAEQARGKAVRNPATSEFKTQNVVNPDMRDSSFGLKDRQKQWLSRCGFIAPEESILIRIGGVKFSLKQGRPFNDFDKASAA
jgi:hypothetical protein